MNELVDALTAWATAYQREAYSRKVLDAYHTLPARLQPDADTSPIWKAHRILVGRTVAAWKVAAQVGETLGLSEQAVREVSNLFEKR